MVELSLRPASKGRFEVILDGQLIFSKAKLKRFPGQGEILRLVEPIVGRPIDWR